MIKARIKKIWRDHKGSVLIALIVTVVILSALGAAMVSLTSTSMFSLVGANSAARAYFLAESGYRYTESEYLNASGQTAKDNTLEAMHNQTYTMSSDEGRFKLDVYPYYFKIIDDPATPTGQKTLNVKVPGGFPPGVTIGKPGWLKIGPKSTSFYRYGDVSVSGVNVTFTMEDNINSYFPVGLDVLHAVESKDATTVTKGGDLQVRDRTTGLPLRNGTILINNHLYSYKENDTANRKLIGIEDPADPNMPDISVADAEMMSLQKFVKLHSTGTFGSGSVEGLANREVVYHIPLPVSEEQRKEFIDTFEDTANWEASSFGTHEVQTIGGDKALKVTGTEVLGGAPKASLIGLNWSATDLDLSVAHASGNPYFLSYDAQVKVGFDSAPVPDWGFDPIPIPLYYAAGLSFRLDNNNNSYGLSFLRGSNATAPTPDNIDDGMVPLDQKSMIVLWQLTDSGATAKWLAYKKDLALFFKDDMESGTNGWTTYSPTGLWHQSARRANSATTAWYYGREAEGDYNTGQNNGALESPSIDLSLATSATLTFWTWIKTEPGGGVDWDRKYLLISVNGGLWTDLPGSAIPDDSRTWHQRSYDLSAYCGQTIKIRFRFDTVDDVANTYEGWYIDDVRISGDTAAAVQEATLAVRVKEAASITFINGGPDPIENLDTVVGQTSGFRGIVAGAPILSSGSWAANTAAGTLMLKNTTGSFNIGEQILAIGSAAVAQVSGFSARDNFIRAYYGNTNGYGTADSNPLNDEKNAHPRGNVNWPADELADWDASNDYFTLIQWDAVNAGVTLVGSVDEPDAIIQDATLTSPTAGPLLQPELGLHTFGKGSLNVYFDDFAVQADVGSSGDIGFERTIQE